MASNLYEVLEVKRDATVEQIRKAYKKKALQTHPDKLPQGLNEEQKKNAEDKFREISHAYEILSDLEKRKAYDFHGVWPPPQPEEDAFQGFFDNTSSGRQRGHRSHTFPSPFFSHHHSYSNFAFRDPFELFDALFQDMDAVFSSSFNAHSPFNSFGGMHPHRSQSLFSNTFLGPAIPTLVLDPFGSGFGQERGTRGSTSESFVSTTINGVTQTIRTRRDKDGNEHVTRTYPDGRELYTVNGIEQPQGYLAQNSQEPLQITPPPNSRYIEPSQPRHQRRNNSQLYIPSRHSQLQSRQTFSNRYEVPSSGHNRYTVPIPPRHEYDVPTAPYLGSRSIYPDNHNRTYNRADHPISHGRERRASDKYPQTARLSHTRDDDRHPRNWFQ